MSTQTVFPMTEPNDRPQGAAPAPRSPDDRTERLTSFRQSLQVACQRLAQADAYFSLAEFDELLAHIRALEDAVAAKLQEPRS